MLLCNEDSAKKTRSSNRPRSWWHFQNRDYQRQSYHDTNHVDEGQRRDVRILIGPMDSCQVQGVIMNGMPPSRSFADMGMNPR